MSLPEARPWKRAAAWLAFLGPFFFASYGFATWVSARRGDVAAIVFDWERHIPFLPWTIVPYWAIDVLYGVSLFVCVSRAELDAHAKRLLTAQVVAVASFLAFPLRFAFERPATGGVFGWMFDLLGHFDQPFNQAPSLHIALLVILWALYARHATGFPRWLVHGGMALIGVSVLTTWQHHFVDVPTGALLGFFCLWLWPIDAPSPLVAAAWTRHPRRRQLAARYAIGAVSVLVAALAIGGAALWLSWIAVALALVACNYAVFGVAGFQKRDGRLSPGAVALLLPYLAGAWINSRAWTRRRPLPDRIEGDLLIGRLPTRSELDRDGIDAVVDLCCELPVDAKGRAYANVPLLDLVPAGASDLALAAQAIERARSHGRVLVCCALGYSRSAAAIVAWLVASGRANDVDAAVARVAAARPAIVLDQADRAGLTGVVPTR